MLIFAHRGAQDGAPENTMASFMAAIKQGADAIELDVYRVIDGETSVLVVHHDDRVDRTTDGDGYIEQLTYEEIRALDAGNGERIPTLDEVLDMIDGRIKVNIELKGKNTANLVAEVIAERCKRGTWTADKFIVSSFLHSELRDFHTRMPHIYTGALFDHQPLDETALRAITEPLGVRAVHPGTGALDKGFVDMAHHLGLEVNTWLVITPHQVRECVEYGVDGIFTDFPEVARQTYIDLH